MVSTTDFEDALRGVGGGIGCAPQSPRVDFTAHGSGGGGQGSMEILSSPRCGSVEVAPSGNECSADDGPAEAERSAIASPVKTTVPLTPMSPMSGLSTNPSLLSPLSPMPGAAAAAALGLGPQRSLTDEQHLPGLSDCGEAQSADAEVGAGCGTGDSSAQPPPWAVRPPGAPRGQSGARPGAVRRFSRFHRSDRSAGHSLAGERFGGEIGSRHLGREIFESLSSESCAVLLPSFAPKRHAGGGAPGETDLIGLWKCTGPTVGPATFASEVGCDSWAPSTGGGSARTDTSPSTTGLSAIVVLCSLEDPEAGLSAIRYIAGARRFNEFVLVAVGFQDGVGSGAVCSEWPETTRELMLDMQRKCFEAGAEDFSAVPDRQAALALVSLSIGRVVRYTQFLENVDKERQEHHQRAEDLQAKIRRHEEEMLKGVQRVFPDIPRMRVELRGTLEENLEAVGLLCQEQLGKGGFGTVHRVVQQKTGVIFAVKAIAKNTMMDMQAVLNVATEIRSLRQMRQHPNTIRIFGVVHTKDTVLLVTTYGGQQNVYTLLKRTKGVRLSRNKADGLAVGILAGIRHMHEVSVAHRDLKPENVVVDEAGDCPRVVDFGCAVVSNGRPRSDFCGTMPFISPEVLGREPYEPLGADIWAWGACCMELVYGIGSFSEMLGWPSRVAPSADHGPRLREVLGGDPNSVAIALTKTPYFESDEGLLEVVNGAMQLDPVSRWSAAKLLASRWATLVNGKKPVHAEVGAATVGDGADGPDTGELVC